MNSENLRPISVGLLWHSFSSDNLGVGALSESQVAICESVARRIGVDIRFIVFGTSGARDYVPTGHNVSQGSHISLRQLVLGRSPFPQEVSDCDVVLDIGEGDSFADIYGARRFRLHIASKLVVLAKRRRLVLSPQTIGPFEGTVARWIARRVMSRCEAVFARDGLSRAQLDFLGSGKAHEAIDVAFRLPFERPACEKGSRVKVGLNVSGLLFSGGYQGANQFGLSLDYPALVRQLLDVWMRDSSVEVWLVPHVLADRVPRDDDRVAIRTLLAEYPAARAAPEFGSPSAAKSFISGLDFLTGARMHACIAAFSSGVPVVPLAYSRKFNGLFDALGYSWYADGKVLSTGAAVARVLEGYARRNELKTLVASAQNIVESKLQIYESFLERMFLSLAADKDGDR
jgi:colanic acid/amylovoran biosynthesis protein